MSYHEPPDDRYSIAGRLIFDERPSGLIKQLREELGISQKTMATAIGIAASVLSDYENGRRRTPGAKFIKKYVNTIMELKKTYHSKDSTAEEPEGLKGAIIKMEDFDKPIPAGKLADALKMQVACGNDKLDSPIYGYTILDSIKTIISLNGNEFYRIFGKSSERALIFTQVGLGRSPMVAIRVSPLKPRMVVIFGALKPEPLAVNLAKIENIIFGISTHPSFASLMDSLNLI
ncbi:MAG: helix-turn-helix domain-containing protein [Nitrososphaerota archaeon]|nr:helix-turn-helix domain-containing protein [Nitrososphaerota archaeon]